MNCHHNHLINDYCQSQSQQQPPPPLTLHPIDVLQPQIIDFDHHNHQQQHYHQQTDHHPMASIHWTAQPSSSISSSDYTADTINGHQNSNQTMESIILTNYPNHNCHMNTNTSINEHSNRMSNRFECSTYYSHYTSSSLSSSSSSSSSTSSLSTSALI